MTITRRPNFDRVAEFLRSVQPNLPAIAVGEVLEPADVVRLMLEVQSKREKVDSHLVQAYQHRAETARTVNTLRERIRAVSAATRLDPDVRWLSAQERADAVASMTADLEAKLATAKSNLSDFDALESMLRHALDTLELAKQTLNAARDLSMGNGAYPRARGNHQPRRS